MPVTLNHLDLPCRDVAAMQAFFVTHFGFRTIFERPDGLVVLLDEAGFALTLSPLLDGDDGAFPKGFHIGFNPRNATEFEEMHARLKAADLPFARELGMLGGAETFQVLAPDGLLVEVGLRP